MPYSNQEKQSILMAYIKNNNNVKMAQQELRRNNARMHVPCKQTIRKIFNKFQEDSNLIRKKRRIPQDEDTELNILLTIQENPNKSIRTISTDLRQMQDNVKNTSYGKIQKTLKLAGYKPFKIRPTPKLTDRQREKRVEFCREMLGIINNNNNFLQTILWTDESNFATNGMINRKNTRHWATENPHSYREFQYQGRQSVNVWCGILDNKIIGPHFFEGMLNGNIYLRFLQNQLGDFLDDLPLARLNQLTFQQDGAPPHNVIGVTNYLTEIFGNWIGRNGPIKWPPNSPDLTPLDAFLWGTLKDRINANNIENIEHLKLLIRNEINLINTNYPESIRNSLEKLRRTLIKCIEVNGGPVEQLYI